MQTLRVAIERSDASDLKRVAHAIKGAVDSCGASGAFDAAMVLERIGASGDLQGAPGAMAALERSIDRARAELAAYIAGDGAGRPADVAQPDAGNGRA